MPAGSFSTDEWRRIRTEFARDPGQYGLPNRVYGSAVLGSFNIRKCGAAGNRSAETWEFLADICRMFDLLAVQEVMDDLSGIERLRELMGPEYGLIVSDTTGAFPGEPGLNERMAFIYRNSVVERAHIVSDVTYDRSKVLNILYAKYDEIGEKFREYDEAMARFEAGLRKTKPSIEMPVFLSFIRQPFTVAFRILGHPGGTPYEIMAVNAHLIYGEMNDRKQEFNALMEWIIARQRASDGTAFPGVFLMGDLNLDFNDPEHDIKDVEAYLARFANKAGDEVAVRMPFLEEHPVHRTVLRTNARLKETFDHIGMFYRAKVVPADVQERLMGENPRGPDYGVVNFVDLFSVALEGKPFASLPTSRHKDFYARFEHSVSDHMPIWFRVPLPDH